MTQPDERRKRSRDLQRLLRLITLGLAVWAVIKELRTPSELRTWHGKVVGFVPYDLRVPTIARVKERMWNPTGGVVSPRVFGVGWTVNVGRILAVVRERISA